MNKNIFVIGLDPYNHWKLQGIRHGESYTFHPLLEHDEVVKPLDYPYEAMLAKAEKQLRRFPGRIDAIINYWDFPADTMRPILCRTFNLPSPSLEDVLKCGHKYWARLEQRKIIPAHIPDFCVFDPFAHEPLAQIHLRFPFWTKPIKSFASYLGFYIDSEACFYRHLPTIRANIPRIGKAFNMALQHANLPPEVAGIGGNHCIAEDIIRGKRQNGPEGFIHNGRVHITGITDSIKDRAGKSFLSFEYPSVWPRHMQEKSIELSKELLTKIGLDNAAFNLEFIWDETNDDLKLIEINPRISQSLSDMFEKVHGRSNHEIAVELALGRKPDYPPAHGRFKCAAKFMWRCYEDALVKRVPTAAEIDQVQNELPGTEVYVEVSQGQRLSDLRDQDSYSYEIAIILLGADDHQQLLQRYARCRQILGFVFAPVGEQP